MPKKRLLIPILVLVFLGLIFAVFRYSTFMPEETEVETVSPIIPKVEAKIAHSLDNTDFVAYGTIKSYASVDIFSPVAGTIKKINFKSGDFVAANNVLIELGGSGETKHPSIIQAEISAQNYALARKSYETTLKTLDSAAKSAEIQLKNSIAQVEGMKIDLNQMDNSFMTLNRSLIDIRDARALSELKNKDDLKVLNDLINFQILKIEDTQNEKTKLRKNLRDAEQKFSELQTTLRRVVSNGGVEYSDEYSTVNNQLLQEEKVIDDLKLSIDKIDGVLSEMYIALDQSKKNRNDMLFAQNLTANQSDSVIREVQNQLNNLELNKKSTVIKTGLEGDYTDALKLAEESYKSRMAEIALAKEQALTQLNIAALNHRLSIDVAESLKVLAPISGVITDLSVSVGDIVSPQTRLTGIISTEKFRLEVGVTPSVKDRLIAAKKAVVEFAGGEFDAPIIGVSPVINERNGTVTVTIDLPPIVFVEGDTLKVRLPIGAKGNESLQNDGESLFIDLDAVTFGSRENHVFVAKEGIAEKRTVKTGEIFLDKVQIIEGLNKNDLIITKGARSLINGSQIELL